MGAFVTGYARYFGLPMNGPDLNAVRFAIGWTWWRALRRRSQRHRITARRLRSLVSRWLPTPRICHPYPFVRLGVVTQGGSRMPESRTSASVRGAPGNPRPYRDKTGEGS